eukprot:6377979-Amphidinium_carterae.1
MQRVRLWAPDNPLPMSPLVKLRHAVNAASQGFAHTKHAVFSRRFRRKKSRQRNRKQRQFPQNVTMHNVRNLSTSPPQI